MISSFSNLPTDSSNGLGLENMVEYARVKKNQKREKERKKRKKDGKSCVLSRPKHFSIHIWKANAASLPQLHILFPALTIIRLTKVIILMTENAYMLLYLDILHTMSALVLVIGCMNPNHVDMIFVGGRIQSHLL